MTEATEPCPVCKGATIVMTGCRLPAEGESHFSGLAIDWRGCTTCAATGTVRVPLATVLAELLEKRQKLRRQVKRLNREIETIRKERGI